MEVRAEMPGVINSILVSEGDKVHNGDEVIQIELMKTMFSIMASGNGVVKDILVKEGDLVAEGETLVVLD